MQNLIISFDRPLVGYGNTCYKNKYFLEETELIHFDPRPLKHLYPVVFNGFSLIVLVMNNSLKKHTTGTIR